MTKFLPFGMPFEKYDDTKKRKPNNRLAFVFQIADQDVIGLLSLLTKTKARNLWKDIFGRATFMVQIVSTKVKGEDAGLTTKRVSYIDMAQKHGSVQLSIGSVNIDGLVKFSKKFLLYRTNEDGTQAPTIRNLVQHVLRYETLDGDTIWLAAVPRDGGGVTGYFSSVLPEVRTYIRYWTQCLTAQFYWFLLHKGYKIGDVCAMRKDSFSIEE